MFKKMPILEPRWARLAAETKRVMVEEIKALEETLKNDNESLEASKKAEAAQRAEIARKHEAAKKAEQAKKSAPSKKSEATHKITKCPRRALRKPSNPFEGAPLPEDFPKTPQNFYKGERVFALDREERSYEGDGGAEGGAGPAAWPRKPYNPWDGAPLSPDFPKTPLNFWKGHVVGEPIVVVTDHDAEAEAEGMRARLKGGGGDERWYD